MMKMKSFPVALLTLMLMLADACHAGMRPLDIVFLNIGDHDFYGARFYESFLSRDLGDAQKTADCWSPLFGTGVESALFGLISRKHVPGGLNVELGRRIWRGDIDAAKTAQKILKKNFEYKPGEFIGAEGYDGMYLFESDGRTLTVMGVGARGGLSKKVKMVIDEADPQKTAAEFSYSLCKAGAPIVSGHPV